MIIKWRKKLQSGLNSTRTTFNIHSKTQHSLAFAGCISPISYNETANEAWSNPLRVSYSSKTVIPIPRALMVAEDPTNGNGI